MRALRFRTTAIVLTAALMAGCASSPEPAPSPTAASPSPSPAASSPSPSPTATPSATADCQPFGAVGATASSPDWAGDLRGGPGEELWGVTMRVGAHACYDRWVLEFGGEAAMPGWSVTPRDASTFTLDPSGEELDPPLAGDASLEVLVGAWYDGSAIGADAYAGPLEVAGSGGAVLEARILGAFEGITQVGLGLDQARPYRVQWLEDPGRLVIDVYMGP